MATTHSEAPALAQVGAMSSDALCMGRRFLTPDDHGWTDDGAGTWVTGRADGLSYTWMPGSRRITLHNRGSRDIAVLSMPHLSGTAGTRFTFVARGTSADLPDAEDHIIEVERIDGRPVMVGQISMTGRYPLFVLEGPAVGDVDFPAVDADDDYWKPGDPDFGSSASPDFVFLEPLGHCVFYTSVDGEVAVHNRSGDRIALLTVGRDGPLDLVEIGNDESAPLPAGDVVCYVQAPRTNGAPTLLGVLWIEAGVVMPSALPLPTRRDYLDSRYLTPSSPDNDSPYAQHIYLDARAENVSYQFRPGASTITIRNGSHSWVAVTHHVDDDILVTEVMPGSAVILPVCVDAERGQVFSVVGERIDTRPGRPVSIGPDGVLTPGCRPRPGVATNYGSVVIMLGSVVYSALPKKTLYLAWTDRRRRRRTR